MKDNYKFWIVLSFLVVFAAGIVSGIILDKRVLDQKPQRGDRTSRRSSVHFPTLDEMAQELGLSDEQRAQVREAFKRSEERIKEMRGQMYKQYSTLRSQFLNEIKSALNEEQSARFDALIERYHAQRKEQMERRKKRPPRRDQEKGEKT